MAQRMECHCTMARRRRCLGYNIYTDQEFATACMLAWVFRRL